jgi:hypothetical protein
MTLEQRQQQENWREHIGRIQNAELVDAERAVSDDEEGGNASDLSDGEKARLNFDRMHRKSSQKRQTTKMKPGLVHTQDYFFLGPNAWMLLKEKFGSDGYEIPRSCCKAAPGTEGQGVIAVALLPEDCTPCSDSAAGSAAEEQKRAVTTLTIEIPASGRFAYERLIPQMNEGSSGSSRGVDGSIHLRGDTSRSNVVS